MGEVNSQRGFVVESVALGDVAAVHAALEQLDRGAAFEAAIGPPGLEDLARWLGAHQGDDAFADGERLSKHAYEPIYGLAYQSFTYLLRRFGAESVPTLMARMRGGLDFPSAFESVYGLSPLEFQQDFERWVRQRTFRGANR